MSLWGSRKGRTALVAVEVLAIMAIIVILLGVGFSVYRGARLTARVVTAENNLKQVGVAMELYYRRNGAYPPLGSNLATVLQPFIQSVEVFSNPLMPEAYPGQTLNDLYFPPTLSEGDSGNHYITAFVSDDGSTAVVLNTGSNVERPQGLSFDPCNPGDIIHQITGETVISGIINVDPRNNTDYEFAMSPPSGVLITRSDLHESRGQLIYSGPVDWVRTWPKGSGNQNGLKVNGVEYPLLNGYLYTISRLANGRMQAHVWNEVPVTERTKKKVHSSEDMGEWYCRILAIGGEITCGK